MLRVATARMRAIPSSHAEIRPRNLRPQLQPHLPRGSGSSRAHELRQPRSNEPVAARHSTRARCTPPWLEHPKSIAHRQLFVRVEWRILA